MVNETLDERALLKKYEQRIKELQIELHLQKALSGRSDEAFAQEDESELEDTIRAYIACKPSQEDDLIEIKSCAQVKSMFRVFKKLYLDAASRSSKIETSTPGTESTETKTQDTKTSSESSGVVSESIEQVGDMQDSKGFAIGLSNDDSRPKQIDPRVFQNEETKKAEKSPLRKSSPVKSSPDKNENAIDKEKAYRVFKSGPGREYNEVVLNLQSQIRQEKIALNRNRNEADELAIKAKSLSNQIEVKKTKRSKQDDDEDIIDEEEYQLWKQYKEMTRKYRSAKAKYKESRSRVLSLKSDKTEAQSKLIDKFNMWFMEKTAHVDKGDVLDYGEEFERMEAMRVMEDDPDSLAFFRAQKSMRSTFRAKKNALKVSSMRKRGI